MINDYHSTAVSIKKNSKAKHITSERQQKKQQHIHLPIGAETFRKVYFVANLMIAPLKLERQLQITPLTLRWHHCRSINRREKKTEQILKTIFFTLHR